MALPLLDAMVPSMTAFAKTPAAPVRRLGFVYMPMGCDIARWTPPGEGKLTELSPTLQSLAPVADQLTVITNLELKNAYPGTHATSNAAFLSAAKAKWTESTRLLPRHDGRSDCRQADRAARRCCRRSSCRWICSRPSGSATTATRASIRTTSRGRRRRRRCRLEAHPRIVFERLFGEGGSAADRRAALQKRASLLDWVREDISRLQNELGPEDRTRVGQYLETVREVERRIQKAEAETSRRPAAGSRSAGGRAGSVRRSCAVDVRSCRCWRCRATSRGSSRSSWPAKPARARITEIGVPDPHHPLTHHGNDPEKIARMAKINAFHVSLFAYFLEKLKSTPEGDGSLLDHSLYLYGSGMGNPNVHDHVNLPDPRRRRRSRHGQGGASSQVRRAHAARESPPDAARASRCPDGRLRRQQGQGR